MVLRKTQPRKDLKINIIKAEINKKTKKTIARMEGHKNPQVREATN